MSSTSTKLAITLSLTGVLALALIIDQSYITKEQTKEAAANRAKIHLAPGIPEPTRIPVTFTKAAPLRQFYNGRSTTFETLRSIEEWSLLETEYVVLINSSVAGAQLCPEALADFMASFSPKQLGSSLHVSYGMPIRALRDLTTRMQDKTAPVSVRIPLFDAPPPRLEKCADFGWAENTGRLTYRGKPVAVMMAEQPQLELAEGRGR